MHNVRHSSGYLRRQKGGCWPIDEANRPCEIDDDVTTTRYYPTTTEERAKFVNPKTSRTVTLFQYRVYDACAQIPPGHFTTYKHLADALGSGPRAVGNALRLNPFAPLPIPCHRVLTSNYFLGGFDGDKHTKIFFKRAKLQKEGLEFDDDGFVQLGLRESRLFADFKV
ncbi:hypothetical protein EV182_005470 [Spiromyces aspiralis]|uniref:Uncharacterized protein n=1 Tax=Spiromyces aspiralis TaxID=68401 RepID=A0ACC1H9Y4_9FUNG|nr:hypothetical protein EV182_005470 [Spiromyces aspiralis]